MHHLEVILTAVKITFKDKRYFAALAFLAVLAFWFFVYIPVKKVPGNSFSFQLSIFKPTDWFLLTVLSFLTSLSLVMNFFVIKRNFNELMRGSAAGSGGAGVLAGIMGSIFGPTASCASCVGSIFGFLGVGGVLFLLKYRQLIVATSIVIILFTLYHTSRRVLRICKIKITKT